MRKLLIVRSLAACLTALPAAGLCGSEGGSIGRDVDLRLELERCLPRPADAADAGRRADLTLDLSRRDGAWRPQVWGYAHDYNRADHDGRLLSASAQGGTWSLKVALHVRGDAWVGGGEASLTLTLDRKGDGLAGRYGGTYRGKPVAGAVRGKAPEPWPAALADVDGPARGEHPRLLFRKADWPRIRRNARSEEGRKLLAALKKIIERDRKGFGYHAGAAGAYAEGYWSAGRALLYHLTGEPEHKKRAIADLKEALVASLGQDELIGIRGRIEGVALAYDIGYGFYPKPLRRRVARWLERMSWELTAGVRDWRPQDMSVAVMDRTPGSTDLAAFRAAAGLAALAILNDPLAYPHDGSDEPLSGHLKQWLPPGEFRTREPGHFPRPKVAHIEPDAKLVGRNDVPVAAFRNDIVLTDFLRASVPEDPAWRPWLKDKRRQPLDAVGGPRRLRATDGTSFSYLGEKGVFRPLAKKYIFHDSWTDHRPAIDLLRDEHLKRQHLDYHYTVLKNDAPRYVRLHLGQRYLWWPKAWINGRPVQDGQIVHLERGLYRLLIQSRLPTQCPYAPYFPVRYGQLTGSGTVRALGRRENWIFNWVVLEDRTAPEWPHGDLWMQPRLVEVADPQARWQAGYEEYKRQGHTAAFSEYCAQIAARSVRRYLDAAVGEHGWGPANGGHTHAMESIWPLATAWRGLFGEDILAGSGAKHIPVTAMFDGRTSWRYSDTGYAGTVRWLAPSWPHVAEEFRPAVREYYRQAGFDAGGRPQQLIQALAFAPWEGPTRSPKTLGLRWADRQQGGFVFRRCWDSVHSLFATLEGGRMPLRSAPLAGAFGFRSDEVDWATRWHHPVGTNFWILYGDENVATVEGALPRAGAKVIYRELRDDASGVVTLDTSEVYALQQPAFFRAETTLGWGAQWTPDERGRETDIRATRSFAADYSSKCGAKGLFVVVDHFGNADGRTKSWRLYTNKQRRGPGPKLTAELTGNTYTVTAPEKDAAMRVTMAGDPEVKLGHEQAGRNAYVMKARTEGNLFFAVMTVGSGRPPAATTRGSGKDTVVTVGSRTVRFDGEKIVLGEAATDD